MVRVRDQPTHKILKYSVIMYSWEQKSPQVVFGFKEPKLSLLSTHRDGTFVQVTFKKLQYTICFNSASTLKHSRPLYFGRWLTLLRGMPLTWKLQKLCKKGLPSLRRLMNFILSFVSVFKVCFKAPLTVIRILKSNNEMSRHLMKNNKIHDIQT